MCSEWEGKCTFTCKVNPWSRGGMQIQVTGPCFLLWTRWPRGHGRWSGSPWHPHLPVPGAGCPAQSRGWLAARHVLPYAGLRASVPGGLPSSANRSPPPRPPSRQARSSCRPGSRRALGAFLQQGHGWVPKPEPRATLHTGRGRGGLRGRQSGPRSHTSDCWAWGQSCLCPRPARGTSSPELVTCSSEAGRQGCRLE